MAAVPSTCLSMKREADGEDGSEILLAQQEDGEHEHDPSVN